jgi:hypothetical protein|tara:strand:+ start:464 stop:874 length:411 start_codon:yes stop_codon:yes gene_type:complete
VITVQRVNFDKVYEVWNGVKDFLEASIETGTGDCTLEQLKLLLTQGKQQLLVGIQDNKIVGAMTVEFINYPNERVMFITALGGKQVVSKEVFSQVEDWAKTQGATKSAAWAKESQARLYTQKAGFNTMRYVMEKKL